MASVKSAFEAYAAAELPNADAETKRVAEEAFHAGALVVLRQVENPTRSFAQQRNRLRKLAAEINSYQREMILRDNRARMAERERCS